jgi:hypothetical protein
VNNGYIPAPDPPPDARWVRGIGKMNKDVIGWVESSADGRLYVCVEAGPWPRKARLGDRAERWEDTDAPSI